MSNTLHGRLVLSKEDSKKIRENFHDDCTLSIGDFKMKFIMIEVNSSRVGKDKINTQFTLQHLDEYIEQNTVKDNDDQQ